MGIPEWHEDASQRERVGTDAEIEFDKLWRCHCGGTFMKNDLVIRHNPDRICGSCGQVLDIKGAPEARDYGMITISQVPYDNYTDETIIAWREDVGLWHGVYRKDTHAEGPLSPTHSSKPTSFYKVKLDDFIHLDWILRRLTDA